MQYVNIALAKGRIASQSYKILKEIGLDCSEIEKNSRKLIFENSENRIRYILVKPADVPIYVEKGAADLGIVGKDTIMEENRNLYELVNLGFGTCRFAVASLKGFSINQFRPVLRVGTKYPNIAKKYFADKNKQVEIIHLNGSVELAPIVGLSDVIVDIVETGRTLEENGLEIIEDICPVSVRLIANKVSFKTKNDYIRKIVEDLENYI